MIKLSSAKNGNKCSILREFLNDLVENVYNEGYVDLKIIQRGLGSLDHTITGTRSEVLSQISELNCNEDNLNVDFIEHGSLNKAYDILDGSSNLEQKIVFMSLCENEEDNMTCGVPSICDSNDDMENIVINVGSEISNTDQFSC